MQYIELHLSPSVSPYIQRMSGERPLAKMGLCLEKKTCGGWGAGAAGQAGRVREQSACVNAARA